MSEWISKFDRKPESKGIYLCASTYGVRCAFFDPEWSSKFQDCATNNDEGMGGYSDDEPKYWVTHWMPLPEPPECKQ